MASKDRRSREDDRPQYAPVPLRAIADRGLSGLLLRVLAIVAAHDRLGANGAGCFRNQKDLAVILGVDYSRLSGALNELVRLNYLTSERHPLNGRQKVWRVVYTAEDRLMMRHVANDSLQNGKPSDPPPGEPLDTLQDRKLSAANVGGTANFGDPIVCEPESQTTDPTTRTDVNIFREAGLNTSRRNGVDDHENRKATALIEMAEDIPELDSVMRGYLRKIADNDLVSDALRVRAKGLLE